VVQQNCDHFLVYAYGDWLARYGGTQGNLKTLVAEVGWNSSATRRRPALLWLRGGACEGAVNWVRHQFQREGRR
jgi:hypothetical protein